MLTHWERSLPSKRTVASDGALPTWSSRLGIPGVTTGGRGRSRSWSSQLGSGWARQRVAVKKGRATAILGGIVGLVGLVGLVRLGPTRKVHFFWVAFIAAIFLA